MNTMRNPICQNAPRACLLVVLLMCAEKTAAWQPPVSLQSTFQQRAGLTKPAILSATRVAASQKNKIIGDAARTDRRSFVAGLLPGVVGAVGAVGATAFIAPPQPASAVLERSSDRFDFSQALSQEKAKQRFREGQKSLRYLLDNFDQICEGGGDNVRRYRGTVGTTSGLWGIGKVLLALRESADDIVEFTELKNELESAIQSADGSAYMAIFVTTSSSSTPPSKYFEDARKEVKLAQRLMDQLAKEIE